MFDILKKKITGFIDRIVKKEEATPAEKIEDRKTAEPDKPIERIPEKHVEPEKPKAVKKEIKPEENPKPDKKEPAKPDKKQAAPEKKEKATEAQAKKAPEHSKQAEKEKPAYRPTVAKPKETLPEPEEEKPEKEQAAPERPQPKVHVQKSVPEQPIIVEQKPAHIPEKETQQEKRELKVGIFSAIKGLVTGEVEISESDTGPMLDEFELELLESDVALEVAEFIKKELNAKLVGAKVKRGQVNEFMMNIVQQTLAELMSSEKQFDIAENLGQYSKPVKIMFIGPNGAGKTTTMAKVANMLLKNRHSVVFAASDTFRAAAIEQLAIHAERLGVPIIQRPYGSDAAAVAFDAVAYATANNIDAVLIDTSGRQETNTNLINELKKMERVIQPHLKIYIGESIAGNALVEQVDAFNKAIGLHGVILTKMDCDPKGGTVLSVTKSTGLPILYVGVGQGYGDLEQFSAEKIVKRMLG